MQSGIYKIVNIANGKLYVGSAVNFEHRWWRHKSLLRKNEHHSSYLQNAWNKDGESNFNFEIIETCAPLKEVLEEREQHYIDALKPEYNMCPKAYNTQGRKTTEQTKQKLSEANRGENNPNFGKPMLEEQKKKISEALKGLLAGENHPMFGKTGENSPNFGKHHSDETKNKMSEARRGKCTGENSPNFGKHHSDETKNKMSEARRVQRGENAPGVKLNWDIVYEIRRRYKEEKISRAKLGIKYGVSTGCIQHIVENRSWKEEEF